MIRVYFYVLVLFYLSSYTAAIAQKTIPLAKRNVSGVLQDSLKKPISGATVKLTSSKDTIQTSTNQFGFYGFKEVRDADFLLSIHALGYSLYHRKYFNNDTKVQVNIPPIQLGLNVQQIEKVNIERLKGPLIKGDTTEFWAKDYIIRDYARLEDLLRRMEGITIDRDGSVFYNGRPVVKALFNNAQYFKGSVREAMKELPADIVERIQIIDQNVEGTGAKNLKSQESSQMMNIVTKVDKSAGKLYAFSLEQGTQSRSKIDGYMRRIDGSDQTSISASYKQLPEGIKSDPLPGSIGKASLSRGIISVADASLASEGQKKEVSAAVGKNIKIGEVFTMYPQYDFSYNDRWSGTKTIAESFYDEGYILRINDRSQSSYDQKHALGGTYSLKSKSAGSIFGNLSMDYSKYSHNNHQNSLRSGMVQSTEEETSRKIGDNLNYRFNIDYRKTLGKRVALNVMGGSTYGKDKGEENIRTDVYGALRDTPDSSVHQLRNVDNASLKNFLNNRITWTASERFKVLYTLGLTHNNSLRDIRSTLLEGNDAELEANLSNYQKDNVLSIPVSLQPEYTFNNGIYLSPSIEMESTWLSGVLNTGTPDIKRFDLLWKPRMVVGYTNKHIGMLQVGYGSSMLQPSLSELNPNAYYSSPYSVQIGNPELKNTRNTNIDFKYSKFFNRIGFNMSMMSNFMRFDNLVTSDRKVTIDPEANVVSTTTSFVNIDAGKRQMHWFSLSKTLKGMNSTLTYSSSITKHDNPYLANGKRELRKGLIQQHTLAMLYNPAKWIDISPELRYNANEDENTLSTLSGKTYNRLFYTELKLSLYLPKHFAINTNLSQALYETTNIMSNKRPFVLNANVEKRLFKEKNGILSFVVMDAARQNGFTNYSSTDFGYTNTLTNLDSRYFLLQFSWQPQKWGKSRHDTGKGRRGDGSFIK